MIAPGAGLALKAEVRSDRLEGAVRAFVSEAPAAVRRAVRRQQDKYGRAIVRNVRAFAPYDTGQLAAGARYESGSPRHGELAFRAWVERDPGPYPRSYRPDQAKYYVPMAINFGRRDMPASRVRPSLFWNRAIDETTKRGGWSGISAGIKRVAGRAIRRKAKQRGLR